MASNPKIILNFLCVLLLINCVQPTYISYYIQYYCDQHPDRRILISDAGEYSALILRSSNGQTISNQKCKVKIIGQNIAGFIATAKQISLNSSNCEDYLKFDNSITWCNEKHVNSVIVSKNELDIEFGTGSNSSSQFELVITTFAGVWNRTCPKTNIRCHGGKQECIYNGLECDGYPNCPSGSDEIGCPTLTTQLIDDIDKINLSEDFNQTAYQINGTIETSDSYDFDTYESSTDNISSSTTVNTTFTTVVSTLPTTIEPSTTTANETQTSSISTTLEPTKNSTTFGTTVNPTTTQRSTQMPIHPTSNPDETVSGGRIALLIIAIILVAIVTGSLFYMYKNQNRAREVLYSPL